MVEVISGIRSHIKVDLEGKGSISVNGLAMLLGISHSLLSCDRQPKKLAEMLGSKGFDSCDREFKSGIPDIAVACIIEYYALHAQKPSNNAKTLFSAFAAVGIRAWFQDVAGYEKPKPVSKLDRAREAYEYMGQMLAIMEYAEDKPGQERINTDGKALLGYLTVDEVLASTPREYDRHERATISMYTSTAYRNLTGKKPEQVVRRYKDKSGKAQTRKVPAYPLDFLPVIQNAIELGFGS